MRIVHGDLNLGDTVSRLQTADKVTELIQMLSDRRVQYLAAVHVADIRLALFTKTDQHPSLFLHIAHAHAGLATVTPVGTCERREYFRWLDLADALEVLQQHLLFGMDLSSCFHVLQRTPTAYTERGAFRLDPFCRG